ncbi:hypothetical protein GOP47_0025078 [Adiantum capillus-veneris]|uniref:Pentatricopeptide repeat-containing protein n=1 Tax=Adiantum capillus-veneris TaxID=13818 RepID=A0A9D4U3A1_ADICA|nr:hypothetical protein GOP47_0025078 [Adiantum capillus-veneris]
MQLFKCKPHAVLLVPCEKFSVLGWDEESFAFDSPSDRHAASPQMDEATHLLDAQKASFASSLRSCSNIQGLFYGRCIHHCILQNELSQDVFLTNLLVQMYGMCGALSDCLSLFSHMCKRDYFAWNFLIRALDLNKESEQAIFLYDFMLREGCLPDKHIYASVLSACASNNDLAHGVQMHARVVLCGLVSDTVVGGNLVSMYGKCGQIKDAANVFYCLHEHSPMCWTSLIAAYVEHGKNEDVIELFLKMQQEGTPLDRITFISILSACAHKGALSEGKCIHEFVLENGFGADLAVANSLVNMYGKCGSVKNALDVFGQLQERDLVSWSSMIATFAECEQSGDAWDTFRRMLQESFAPNRVTFINILSALADESLLLVGKQLHAALACQDFKLDALVSTALLNMYRNCGDLGNALFVYRNLPVRDEAANVSILSVCANYGALKDGKEANTFMTLTGVDLESNVCIALVNMYGKCGSLEEAQRTFEMASKHDVILWNAMAAAYSQNGQGLAVLGLFERMQGENVQVNKATYSTLLTACSHAGLVDAACHCFVAMNEYNEMKPVADQFNCMSDLLARTGRLDEAADLVNSMPLKPTASSWFTLLSLCRTHIDVKLGESSAKHGMELDQEGTGSYVVLANIFSHEHGERWNKVSS